MRHRFLYPLAAAFLLFFAFPQTVFGAYDGGGEAEENSALFSKASSSYQNGTLNGLTFSNPWADYKITFPEGTYFNPDSLVEYMSDYTGLDYEFAASLYGDMTVYPCINITFQDALIPLKECTQNLLDLYAEKEYDCTVEKGVWVGNHPFTFVRAESQASEIYVDNYLRINDNKLIWICIKCRKDDAQAQSVIRELLNSVTAYDVSGS